ncbi:MAG TPA: hypothetical protein VK531_12345 [Gemmatimonadales bacterium]|nr:hypothetical protein [Gemmatimonadales bacterium]
MSDPTNGHESRCQPEGDGEDLMSHRPHLVLPRDACSHDVMVTPEGRYTFAKCLACGTVWKLQRTWL